MKLHTTVSIVSCLFFTLTVGSCPGSQRYCENTEAIFFAATDWETYGTEAIRQEWEMFEGSIALTQVGIFWKEYSNYAADQIGITSSLSTSEVLRIRRAWHLPYYSDAGAYNDETDGNQNDSRQELISVHNPSDRGTEYFAGDVVPF